jgi:hypothetical protein
VGAWAWEGAEDLVNGLVSTANGLVSTANGLVSMANGLVSACHVLGERILGDHMLHGLQHPFSIPMLQQQQSQS